MKQHLVTVLLVGICTIPAASHAQPPLVKLEALSSGDAQVQRVFFGRVVARETVELAFQVGGQIVQYPVEEGATVQTGQLVAQMDQEPFQLALEQSKAEKAKVDRTAKRYRELVGSAVTESTLQDAETQAELARIGLRNAERDLANATLHAPFDGVVAARLVPNFSTVGAGSPVIRLHDMSDLRVEIDVPETLVQQVGRSTSVDVFAEFPSSDKKYKMELREFNAETARTGQTYSITLGMAPTDDLDVLPGASAKVTAHFSNGQAGLIAPTSAIVSENDGTYSVMAFSPAGADEGSVHAVPVDITPTDTGKVKILSGLTEGQEIVAIGANALNDGDAVRRFLGFEK